MNGFLKETFTVIIFVLALLYVLFSFGNGTFNFQYWSDHARSVFAGFGGFFSFVIFVIQALRYG